MTAPRSVHRPGLTCDRLLDDPLTILADAKKWPIRLCPEVAYALKFHRRKNAPSASTVITPHAIRKTAITLALANGASPKAVANRVGHADSPVTLDIYSSITESMDDALLDIITGIMPQGDGGKTA